MSFDSRRVKDLFVAALDVPDPAARAALLDRECAGDAHLRQRVDVLLAAHDRPESALERPLVVDTDPDTATFRPRTETVGTVIAGKYKLLEPIGEGGMGAVWVADQQEPIRRRVALKVIKAGMDSRSVLARFEAERQALALMDHPNIARVLDAGATADGRPFFAMELVKGTPITEFCDARKLTPRERLELFVPVCQAIQHAHQKGIIHRDLKPSNVLVALHDEKPVPKVIDFGVAKAIGQQLTEKTIYTGFGALVGTPAYMAPEQATFNQLDVDTRADVYALGVLLYELLTGTTPFEKDRLKQAALEEVLRLVREEEPPRPSARLSTSQAKATIAAVRQSDPDKLMKLVRGELDWIVMKALEKDRNRRYETANGLARDVQRYLADDVVEARPPSARYRVRKFARRHKKPLATAAAFLLLVIVGLAVSVWQAVRATAAEGQARTAQAEAETDRDRATRAEAEVTTERDTAIAEKRRADEQASITQAVSDFLQRDLLDQAAMANQPEEFAHDRDMKVRTLLDRAARKIEGRFADRPLTEAAIRLTIGNTYFTLGEFAAAQPHIERAIQLWTANLGADHLETLKGKVGLAKLFHDMGKYERAENLWVELIRVQTAKLGANHLDTLTSKHGLAADYQNAGKYDLEEPLLLEVIEGRTTQLGADDPLTLSAKASLAWSYSVAWMYSKARTPNQAEALFLDVIRTTTTKWGADDTIALTSKYGLAQLYRRLKKFDQAEQLYLEVIRTRRAKLGADHPSVVGVKHGLARSYWLAGRYDQAEPLYLEVMQYVSTKFGPNYAATLDAKHGLARVYYLRDKYDLAEPLFREEVERRTAELTSDHDHTLESKYYLISCCERTGQLAKLESLRRELAEAWKRKAGPESPQYAGELAWLGHTMLRQRKWTDAEPVVRECLAIREKAGPDVWTTFNARSMLGGALLGQEKYADAEPLLLNGYRGMIERESKIPPLGRERLPEAADRLIELYTALKKPEEVEKWRIERAKYSSPIEKAPPPREVK